MKKHLYTIVTMIVIAIVIVVVLGIVFLMLEYPWLGAIASVGVVYWCIYSSISDEWDAK